MSSAASHPAFFASATGTDAATFPQGIFEDFNEDLTASAAHAWPDTVFDAEQELEPPIIELPLDTEGKGLAAGAVTRLGLWCRAGMPSRVGLWCFYIRSLFYLLFSGAVQRGPARTNSGCSFPTSPCPTRPR